MSQTYWIEWHSIQWPDTRAQNDLVSLKTPPFWIGLYLAEKHIWRLSIIIFDISTPGSYRITKLSSYFRNFKKSWNIVIRISIGFLMLSEITPIFRGKFGRSFLLHSSACICLYCPKIWILNPLRRLVHLRIITQAYRSTGERVEWRKRKIRPKLPRLTVRPF